MSYSRRNYKNCNCMNCKNYSCWMIQPKCLEYCRQQYQNYLTCIWNYQSYSRKSYRNCNRTNCCSVRIAPHNTGLCHRYYYRYFRCRNSRSRYCCNDCNHNSCFCDRRINLKVRASRCYSYCTFVLLVLISLVWQRFSPLPILHNMKGAGEKFTRAQIMYFTDDYLPKYLLSIPAKPAP